MVVLFDRKRFEAALPHMPAGFVPLVMSSSMRGQEPLHSPTQSITLVLPDCKMTMIRHQAIGQEAHRHMLAGILEQGFEGLIVPLGMKHFRVAGPTIDHVVAIISD